MADEAHTINGVRVLAVDDEGASLASERGALDVIGNAHGHGCTVVALPAARLGEPFFTLKTRIAGDMLQKFMNYNFRVAIVGDIAAHIAASDALRDFVYESNRGKHVWFVANLDELSTRLQP